MFCLVYGKWDTLGKFTIFISILESKMLAHFIFLHYFTDVLQCLPPDRYDSYCKKTVTIWIIFECSSVFSWQFSKISQKIAKRNDLVCNDLVVGTVIINTVCSIFQYILFNLHYFDEKFVICDCFKFCVNIQKNPKKVGHFGVRHFGVMHCISQNFVTD